MPSKRNLTKHVIDTHALLWYFTDDPRLGRKAKKILEDDTCSFIIPSIVLAELKYILFKKKKLNLYDDILESIINDQRCTIYPLDVLVLEKIPIEMNIHDGIIVGTALVFDTLLREPVDILTRNGMMKDLQFVPTIW